MNRRTLHGIGSSAILLAVLAGCERDDPNSVLLLGTLEREAITLTSPVTEQLVERPVREGDHVKKGALVARIDDSRLRAELGIYEAARGHAQAQLVELQAGTSRERIAQGEAEYSGTVASAANARAELNRVKKLFDDKLVPQSNLDRAQAASDEAEANKKRSAQVLEELKRGTRAEALDVARAALAEADARIREAEARIAQLELRAPVDAIVDELVFEIGERPPQGSVVVILASDTTPYANVFVPARAISRVTPGLAAKLTIDGVEGPLDGEFGFVATDAMFTPYYSLTDRERARLVYRAKVILTDPRGRNLHNGIPVQVNVALNGAPAERSALAEPQAPVGGEPQPAKVETTVVPAKGKT